MTEQKAPWHFLALLILSGEAIFYLPFVLSRVFRPTVLEVFNLDNTQLGYCFSVYGLVALFSYLFGGPIADKYPPRKLIAVALWLTGIGGWVYASFPNYFSLKVLYAYWGFTTIFLFWAPMIKAARIWGGSTSQGKAYGFLDGGRGMVGALLSTLCVFIFSLFIHGEIQNTSTVDAQGAFRYVILISSALVILIGILVWFFMKLDRQQEQAVTIEKITLSQIKDVLQLQSVWLLMIIILCAYVSYKVTDIFSLFARDVMMYDQIEAAGIGSLLLYGRPIIGVGIGILADRTQISLCLFVSFVVTLIGAILFASGIISEHIPMFFFISVIILATGVYAARSLYFAVMKKGQIPILLTGTAVGIISLVGFTPDIFMGPLLGILLDGFPGVLGHQYVFGMLSIFTLIGSLASFIFYKKYR